MAQKIISVSATPTISAALYASGNALGGMLTFTGAANGGQANIIGVTVTDKSGQSSAMDLVLFNQSFTPTADKSAINISSADLVNCIGSVNVPSAHYKSVGTGSVCTVSNVQLGAVAATDNNLYGQLVCRGTPTYVSTSDLKVTVTLELSRGDL